MKPLHLITKKDDFRPAWGHIQLINGHFYTTDGHILLKYPAKDVFPAELLEQLGDEAYFTGQNWKDAKVDKMYTFKLNGDLIEVIDGKYKTLGYLKVLRADSIDFRYPQCDNVMHSDDTPKVAMEEVAFNPELLDTLYKANGKKPLKLAMYGENKGIRVTFHGSDAVGLLMPMLLF